MVARKSPRQQRPGVGITTTRRRFRWPRHLLALLGKVPDTVVARKAEISGGTVLKERYRRGIAPFVPLKRVKWTPQMIALLGMDTDQSVAAELGVSSTAVNRKRRLLGIPPYSLKISQGAAGYLWTPRALARLGRDPDVAIAADLGVHPVTVRRKRRSLGIRAVVAPRWSDRELALLGALPDAEVARLTARSCMAVQLKRNRRRAARGRAGRDRRSPEPEDAAIMPEAGRRR